MRSRKSKESELISKIRPIARAIMRAFVRMREILSTHKEFARRFDQLEERMADHDEHIVAIFEAIRQLMKPPEPPHSLFPLPSWESLS